MPFMTKVCRICQQDRDHRMRSSPNSHLPQSMCLGCEKKRYQTYQKNNPSYFREANKRHYLNKVGSLSRRVQLTEEERKEYYREKALKRYTRAKEARVSWDTELTEFVVLEARKLNKLREVLTGIKWHLDHILPLKGANVCGLHVWNNLMCIPACLNLEKSNKLLPGG